MQIVVDHYEIVLKYPNGDTNKVFLTKNQARGESEYSSYDGSGEPEGTLVSLVHVTIDDEITLKTRSASNA